jgi:hypothetical protein
MHDLSILNFLRMTELHNVFYITLTNTFQYQSLFVGTNNINEKNVQITDKGIYVSYSTHCKYKQRKLNI